MTSTRLFWCGVLAILATGCVSKKKYNQSIDELLQARQQLTDAQADKDALQGRLSNAQQEQDALRAGNAELSASLAEQERALLLLKEQEARAKARIQEYQDLVSRFQAMIDAGQLSVRIVEGRMVVELDTDILFDTGKARLSKDGTEALEQVAAILSDIPERSYQIEGHTDNIPIRTRAYPSNWELASARSIAVVKTLTGAGLSADRVSAASFAENRPVADNTDPTGRAQNRRIEIVVVPDLSLMPGAEDLAGLAEN